MKNQTSINRPTAIKIMACNLLLAVVFSGCMENEYEKRLSNDINDMKKPCVVVAVKKRDADAGFHGGFGSIVIKDANGVYVTFDGNSYNGEALVATYNAGDTIR